MPPPLEIPVRGYPTPQIADGILYEVFNNEKGNYRPHQPGEPHPDTVKYSGFVFAQQVHIPGNEKFIQKIWVNDRTAENSYNADKGYSEESNDHPIFRRTYIARRTATGRPLTKGAALTGIVGIRVTNAGSGYETPPAVTFTGGAGSGATATAVIFRNTVVAVIITAEGTGYTSAPTVVFTSSTGVNAAATAIIQPATALLTEEEEQRMEDSPLDSLFVRVIRTYETLPGPTLTGQNYNRERAHGAKVDETVQRVLASSASLPDLSLTVLDARLEPVSSVISRKILQTLASGETQPTLSGSHVDPKSGIISDFTKKFVVAGTLGSVATTSGVISSLVITNAGTGYTSIPTLVFSGGGGSSGAGTVSTMTAVTSAPSAAGTGYVPTDTVTLTGGTFSTAVVLTVATTKLISLAINARGSGYAVGNVITLSGGTFTTAASVTVATISLASLAINAIGTGYVVSDTITLAGGTFSAAAVLTVATLQLASLAINAGGTGYVVGDTITLAGGTFSTAAVLTVATLSGSAIATFTISNRGSYTVGTATPTQGSTSGAGTGATFQTGAYGIATFTISTRGSYTVGTATPTQGSTSGAGTGATFQTGSYGVETFTLTNAGAFTANSSTFTQDGATAPTGGTGATFQTAVYGVNTTTITTAGTYSVLPSNPVSQGSTSGAGTSATFTVTWGILSVTLTNAGSGYTSQPTVTVTGGAGSSAGVFAIIGLTYTEIQPVDKWLSIQITTSVRLSTLPSPRGYHYVRPFTFPDTLRPLSGYSNTRLRLVSNSAVTEIALISNVQEGYSGPCAARCIERYLYGLTLENYVPPSVTTFHPESYDIQYLLGSTDNIVGVRVPKSLHPAITIGAGTVFQATIPATTPTELPEGEYICVDIQPEQWRNGVWFVREFFVRVPVTT